MGPFENNLAGRGERCLLCRRPLGRRGNCPEGTCPECSDAVATYFSTHRLQPSHRGLAIKHLWEIACATNRFGGLEAHRPQDETLLRVPTYYGNAKTLDGEWVERDEFDEPNVPVLVHEADGVRLVLGSHDSNDLRFPDVQIERRPNGWALFLRPIGDSDPSGYVYFLDDGRSYVMPESHYAATPPIELLPPDDQLPEIDLVQAEPPAA
jgi:hypothetical protein